MTVPTAVIVTPGFDATVATPSPSQRAAIEAPLGALLVLAGPGAGKTYCLIERIRFLIEHHGVDPARICAFTFTNKAAGEIAHRLEARLGEAAHGIKRGTIHAFCADLLRKHGAHVQLDPGFGIADEEYQLSVLSRLEGPRRWHRNMLSRFSAFRFRGDALRPNDLALFDRYERFLAKRNVLDFDTLVIKAAELLERPEDAAAVRLHWDVVLVDEFQDLNPIQYKVIRALAGEHRHIFAVGDDEQSIYSWAGADPRVFRSLLNDFQLSESTQLEENRRCPRGIVALARKLIARNTPIFADRTAPLAHRESVFPVEALGFENDDDEAAWIIEDIRRDRERHGHRWGDVAVLYRKHDLGHRLETALVNAGVPCRLAQGRALADDAVVAYVIAAVRVIANADDDVCRDAFFNVVLLRPLYDEARAKADESGVDLRLQLRRMEKKLPRADQTGRQIRRALADWKNLEAVGKQHTTLTSLVLELLSRKVGRLRSVLDDHCDEITDPASLPDVVRLASRLRNARARRAQVWIPPLGGIDIAIKGMLVDIGIDAVRGDGPFDAHIERLGSGDVPSLGLALGVFKAAQLIEMGDSEAAFTSFTAIDLETTDKDSASAEIVEIAAVRVRDGRIVETFWSRVKPHRAITPGANKTHGMKDADLVDAPRFRQIWPEFRAFCGEDVIVAHNGYGFDFKILLRMAKEIDAVFDLCTFDTLPLARELFPTSLKLVDLARHFRIPSGQSHSALDDTKTLARLLMALGEVKLSRARKTALVDLLGHLGVALALYDDAAPSGTGNREPGTGVDGRLCSEARLLRDLTRVFALGRYSGSLERYEKERGDDPSVPTVDEVIERLGGKELMLKIQAVKSADERYPAAMRRLRRLIAEIPESSLEAQLTVFLERVVLSSWDGLEPERERVNLLTLHSTKGLEFSRVYIVGAEDASLPGGSPSKGPTAEETEEARRLLYVGMTRTVDRLVLTCAATRGETTTEGHQFLDEMGLTPTPPS